ncbi:hypothetical protein [Ideonella sp.]|uniref:hypothetical protein n=1 Tax=Ideonella sp. TaxID=1929293 RepID=UPI0037BFD58B
MKAIAKLISASLLGLALSGITFAQTPVVEYYASRGNAIDQYSTSGALERTYPLTGADSAAKGIAFGPGGMYVVRSSVWGTSRVEVFNEASTLIRTYSMAGQMSGLVTSGNLRFAPDKKTFYVSALDGVYRFPVSGTAGEKIIDVSSTDVAVMPNGELLVAENYSISRYSADGKPLSSVTTLSDPHRLAPPGAWLVNVRGVTYDPRSDTTFVTMLGYSDFYFQLIALEGTSNVIKGRTQFGYANTMNLTPDGKLLVGSWTQSPGMFSFTNTVPMTFTQIGSLQAPNASFVTSKRWRTPK